jgi:hypothetical protein
MAIETLAVLVGPLVIVGMILYVYVRSNSEEIKANWVQYRCNPIYMPFAGMFTDNVSENFQFCMYAMVDAFFDYALVPVHRMFGMFIDILQTILGQMNVFRSFITGIQNFITSFFTQFMGKIGNTFGTLVHLLSSLKDITARIVASGAYAAMTMSTGVNFFLSLFSFTWTLLKTLVGLIFGLAIILMFVFPPLLLFFIPIGVMVGVSYSGGCFHPDTPMQMASGELRPISGVRVGDVLRHNVRVTGVLRFTPLDPMYMYRGVCVSGSHLVCDVDDVWKRVDQAPSSVLVIGPTPPEIICLNTDTHRIYVKDCTFADYVETDRAVQPPPLRAHDTLRMSSGEDVPIEDCEPGMETDAGSLRCVVDLGDDRRHVIVDNSLGLVQINGRTWMADYLGLEHFPAVYAASERRALRELNRELE